MADHRDTLLLPFEKGLLPLPASKGKWSLFNGDVLPTGEQAWAEILNCEQGFRSVYLDLEQAGFNVEPSFQNPKNQDGTMVLANRSRRVNEENLARAWNATKQGGVVLFAGNKTAGVQPLRKWAGKRVELAGSLSKNHAVVFWLVRNGDEWPLEENEKMAEGYHVAPGMFSASGPDKGSRLLAEYFATMPYGGVRGRVADFGAGWGYLSAELLKVAENIETLELYEADYASLEAAKMNVGERAEYYWSDLTREAPRGPYNWIIMNPPFHTGRAAEPRLGNIFIEAAAKALPAGGHLLLVANTNLPYETTLTGLFKKVERKAQANGFKIIEAIR
ncbi:MAG: class I SAM-dependent methyltransferase [Rhizobiaceae bacterium]